MTDLVWIIARIGVTTVFAGLLVSVVGGPRLQNLGFQISLAGILIFGLSAITLLWSV